MQVRFNYAIGDKVLIDGDPELIAIVTSWILRGPKGEHREAEVSYHHNGQVIKTWVEEWRLFPWEE